MQANKTLVITGPTATGKSEVGIIIARKFAGELISADSRQIYKGFIIGTSAPVDSPVPYHLVNFLEAEEQFDAMSFVRLARRLITEIQAREHLPIVVGGTGLYIRALCEGLFEVPSLMHKGKDEELRARLRKRFNDGEDLWAELKEVDPESAERISPRDFPRIERALEVWYNTGKPITYWHKEGASSPLRCQKFLLRIGRDELYRRINERVERMFSAGWVEEVERLLSSGVSTASPAFQSVGYREICDYLQGKLSLDEAKERIKRRTRHYARRQMIWFRKEPGVIPVDITGLSADEIAGLIARLAGIE